MPPRSWQVPDEPAAPHPADDGRPASSCAAEAGTPARRRLAAGAGGRPRGPTTGCASVGQLPAPGRRSGPSSPSRCPATTPGSPPWPTSRSPPDGSSARSATCTASGPPDHPLPQRLVRHGHWPTGYHPMRRDADPTPRFERRHRLLPVRPRRGRRRLRDPRRPHPRRAHRARALPVLRRRRDHPADEGPAVVPAPRRREALRGPHPARGHRAGRADQRRHRRRAHPGLRAGRRGRPRHRGRRPRPRPPGRCCSRPSGCYNHVNDLGAIANDVGYGIAHAHTQRLRETLLRHNKALTGHRLLRGGITIGGAHLRTEPRPRPDPPRRRRGRRDRRDHPGTTPSSPTGSPGRPCSPPSRPRHIGTLGYVARASGLPHRCPRRPPVRRPRRALHARDRGRPATSSPASRSEPARSPPRPP